MREAIVRGGRYNWEHRIITPYISGDESLCHPTVDVMEQMVRPGLLPQHRR